MDAPLPISRKGDHNRNNRESDNATPMPPRRPPQRPASLSQVAQQPQQQKPENKKWFRAINTRLMEDKITATRIKREQTYTKRTWEPILSFNADLPNSEPNIWLTNSEVLVGRRMLRPLPGGDVAPEPHTTQHQGCAQIGIFPHTRSIGLASVRQIGLMGKSPTIWHLASVVSYFGSYHWE